MQLDTQKFQCHWQAKSSDNGYVRCQCCWVGMSRSSDLTNRVKMSGNEHEKRCFWSQNSGPLALTSYAHALYHWGDYTSGIRSKNINIYHKVNSNHEIYLLLRANQSISNLAISQQNRKYKHSSYGRFHHGFRNIKYQNFKSEASMNFANPNSEF